MHSVKTVLVVDDNSVNRAILAKILSKEYAVIEAENGQAALELLNKHNDEISALMLDLTMPVMDGYAVLESIRKNGNYDNLPIIVTTGCNSYENERKVLSLGAWDFVTKPYDAEIIMFRLKNSIERSQLSAFKELKYLSEYDALTGIYNKTKFFEATREMLDASSCESFVFMRFDVDRFQLINSFFGTAEGDRLLKYITNHLAEDANKAEEATYGRISSDIVALCLPFEKESVEEMVRRSKRTLALYNTNYDIVPSIGIYVIDDKTVPVEEMYNRATLAAKRCKGNYVEFYAYYNKSMSEALTIEQEITNEMNYALENKQFEIYLQPQYNLHTNLPCGAESLVRWIHPKKGILSPSVFIPVFERNGFITKLDYYVWEETCKFISARNEKGIRPDPISVNISRVNIYNPNLPETLLELVDKYNVDPSLLHLELTESAYTDNPVTMKKTMRQLQDYGFIIMMDDFGTGYSSLSLLKDIAIDILKIDMQFLSVSDIPGRGENIIASVIRMAKWLNIPVIAEGAETSQQVDFLRSVGCEFVQGYYFAHPMPTKDYNNLCINLSLDSLKILDKNYKAYHYDDLFSANQEIKQLFSSSLQPAVIYEVAPDKVEIIRVNEAYYALLGQEDMSTNAQELLNLMDEEHKETLFTAFNNCNETQKTIECEYMRRRKSGTPIWIRSNLSYISMIGDKKILIGELTDITMHKELNEELQKYRTSLLSINHNINTVLIVDDVAINRIILKKILQDKFEFLEAENGEEAIQIIKNNKDQIDLILLDICMPVMDGKEFLQYKKKSPELDGIPVIIITADSSTEQQITTFSLGANDYIVKPFIPEVVSRRVNNVIDSNHRFKEMVKEYNAMSGQIKKDLMTGLFNRVSAEELMTSRLKNTMGICAMLMLDIDNFKKLNDLRGHDYGDKVICAVAEKLREVFRKTDIIARMGGDEFAVFLDDITGLEFAEDKAKELCLKISDINLDDSSTQITCSVGICVSYGREYSFEILYRNADKALYGAKCHGRNTVSVYGKDSVSSSISKWINDAESVVDEINDSIYACDSDSYEMIYVNDNLCKIIGVTRDECKGRKCYDVLMRKDAPCEFCSMPKMQKDKIYTRLFRMPSSDRIFLMRGKTVDQNGTIVHLEVAVDMTDVENIDLYWKDAIDNGKK